MTLLVLLQATAGSVDLPPRHHPVKIPVPESMELPDSLKPDEKGRLICSTCHGVKDLEKLEPEEVDTDAPDFLRGGPWRRMEQFCFQCHDEEGYRRLNIHLQLDEQGEPKKETCEYCHREIPDREDPPAREALELRLPVDRICLGCHLKTPHLNALEHSHKPDEQQLEQIHATEKQLGVKLPLDDQGRVTCISCHSPHEEGVIPEHFPGGRQVAERAVEKGPEYVTSRWQPVFAEDKRERLQALAQRLDQEPGLEYHRLAAEVLMRLPARDGTLCTACHAFED